MYSNDEMLIPLLMVVLGPALAQTNLGVGSIGGAIRDESKAVVAGAKVILTDDSKGLVARVPHPIRAELFCSHR